MDIECWHNRCGESRLRICKQPVTACLMTSWHLRMCVCNWLLAMNGFLNVAVNVGISWYWQIMACGVPVQMFQSKRLVKSKRLKTA